MVSATEVFQLNDVGLTTREAPASVWSHVARCGNLVRMTSVVHRRFVARRHVDYGRVRSAICPAF